MRWWPPIACNVLLACCLSAATDTRGEAPCLPLTAANPDGNYIVPGARGGILYRRVGGRDLMLDLWVPPRNSPQAEPRQGSVARPAVIVVHGGGFTSGSRVAFVGQFLELLTASGYPWVSIDYRLGGPSRRTDAVEDLQAAVAFTRCHARDLAIDRDRLVLLGEDAGAALAMNVALQGSPGVIGAVLVGGVYADTPPTVPTPDASSGSRFPPSGATPRFLVVHGTSDTEVPLARAEAWCRARPAGTCELLAVEGASHRPENWWPVQWGYKARLATWLNQLAPVPASAAPERTNLSNPLGPGLYKRIPYGGGTDRTVSGAGSNRSVDGGRSTVNGERLTLDAWVPRDRSRPAPAVVLLHGGGWEAGDRVTYITPIFEPLARAGFAWFSVDYRLTPAVRHPEQLADIRAALAFVRQYARTFGIDGQRVVLVGESASAQLAALLATEDLGLAGVVSFYGVYDFLPMVTDASPRSLAVRLFGRTVLDDETRAVLREYSPLHQARRDMRPMLLIHGTNERLWDQGVRMAARLSELGVEHELVRLDGAPHGMENWEGHAEWQFYKSRLVSWVRQRVEAPRR